MNAVEYMEVDGYTIAVAPDVRHEGRPVIWHVNPADKSGAIATSENILEFGASCFAAGHRAGLREAPRSAAEVGGDAIIPLEGPQPACPVLPDAEPELFRAAAQTRQPS
jgi:hypothetical protein